MLPQSGHVTTTQVTIPTELAGKRNQSFVFFLLNILVCQVLSLALKVRKYLKFVKNQVHQLKSIRNPCPVRTIV